MKGYMYILRCSNGSYYTGSTKYLELRLSQHQAGQGANHTKKYLPVELVYFEEFQRIDHAFYREKQVQGWGRKKKEALINGNANNLPPLSVAYRDLTLREPQCATPQETQCATPQETQCATPQETQRETPQETQRETPQETQRETPQETQC